MIKWAVIVAAAALTGGCVMSPPVDYRADMQPAFLPENPPAPPPALPPPPDPKPVPPFLPVLDPGPTTATVRPPDPVPELAGVPETETPPTASAAAKPRPVNPRRLHHHQRAYYVTGTIKQPAATSATSAPAAPPAKPKPRGNPTRTSSLDPAARTDVES